MPVDDLPVPPTISANGPGAWKPLRRPDVISQPAGAETLLYNPQTDSIHVLNRTAFVAWECCDGAHTRADIMAALRTGFGGTAEMDIAGDVDTLLALFSAQGLLHAGSKP